MTFFSFPELQYSVLEYYSTPEKIANITLNELNEMEWAQ